MRIIIFIADIIFHLEKKNINWSTIRSTNYHLPYTNQVKINSLPINNNNQMQNKTYSQISSCHTILTTNKKLNRPPKSTTLLGFLRKGMTQGNLQPTRLERRVNTGNGCFLEWKTYAAGSSALVGNSELDKLQTTLTTKSPKGILSQGSPTILWDLPPGAWPGSHGIYWNILGKYPWTSCRGKGKGAILKYTRTLCPS